MTRVGRGTRYSIGLLIAAVAIIVIGVAIRPAEKRAPAPVSEMESARLQRLAQERRLQELGDYISYAAENAASGLIFLPQLDQTAVAIDRSIAATAARQISGRAVQAISASGKKLEFNIQTRRPGVPVLLLRSGGFTLSVPPAAIVGTGDWVVAVALRSDGATSFAYGLYENSVQSRCGSGTYTRLRSSIALTNAFVGGGLFSLRGALAGVIARCDSDIVALSVDSILSALNRPVPPNDWLQDRYGFRVETTDANGLRIVTVWKSSPADQAGMQPGDSLLRIDGEDVSTEPEVVSALGTPGDHTATLQRGRRTLHASLVPATPGAEIHAAAAGIAVADSPDGVVIRSVDENGPAARAGILPGDIVTRIGSAPVTSAESLADTLVQSGRSVVLALQRGDSRFDVRLSL